MKKQIIRIREGIMAERLAAYCEKWECITAKRRKETGDGGKKTKPVTGRL